MKDAAKSTESTAPAQSSPGPAAQAVARHLRAHDRSLVLVGMMGAGKTSVGRRLAHRLDLPFRDADAEIEAAAGCPIPEIFARFGEPEFREGERRVIRRLLTEQGPLVLATGGGAFMAPETRALIREHAWSLWLRADLDVLVQRTAGRTHRPLLNEGDPRVRLDALLAARDPVYAEADVVVDTGQEPLDRTAQRALAALARHVAHDP